ncbi:MAG: ArnT family glycosyltransferase [Polyangiaceae bacterium]
MSGRRPKTKPSKRPAKPAPAASTAPHRRPLNLPRGIKYALAFSFALLALRLWVASKVGFGDAEALYASYALHPQPAYLDHPGLIGFFAGWLGDGQAPAPLACHVISAFLSTALPWLGAWTAWQLGAKSDKLHYTVIALLLLPEVSIGLFGFTPDLLLAPLWILALGAYAGFVKSEPGSTRALGFALLGGACLGLGILSKISMLLLLPVLFVSLRSEQGRRHVRTLAPWGALLIMGVLCWPFVRYEVQHDYPMWHHRLVSTQGASGFSLRNLGALIGGQLLYVTPPFLIAGYYIVRQLDRSDFKQALLLHATWIPALPLGVLCLWSKVAEPHWLGPCYLALCIGASVVPAAIGRRVWISSAAVGGLAILLSAAWVGTDLPPRVLGKAYEARYDLANDMYAWDAGLRLVKESITDAELHNLGSPAPPVVGPHWVICAQLEAGLQRRVQIGCRTPAGDDFRSWYPEAQWWNAARILYVTDDRFAVTTEQLLTEFPDRRVVSKKRTTIIRGRVPVRQIEVTLLERNVDVGFLAPAPNAAPSPPRFEVLNRQPRASQGRASNWEASLQLAWSTCPSSHETKQRSPALPLGNGAPPLCTSAPRALRTNVSVVTGAP